MQTTLTDQGGGGARTLEQRSSSISSMSWKRVTMRCPSRRTGALKQHGAADVMNLPQVHY